MMPGAPLDATNQYLLGTHSECHHRGKSHDDQQSSHCCVSYNQSSDVTSVSACFFALSSAADCFDRAMRK